MRMVQIMVSKINKARMPTKKEISATTKRMSDIFEETNKDPYEALNTYVTLNQPSVSIISREICIELLDYPDIYQKPFLETTETDEKHYQLMLTLFNETLSYSSNLKYKTLNFFEKREFYISAFKDFKIQSELVRIFIDSHKNKNALKKVISYFLFLTFAEKSLTIGDYSLALEFKSLAEQTKSSIKYAKNDTDLEFMHEFLGQDNLKLPPRQQANRDRQNIILPYAIKIWELDADNILMPLQVAKIISERIENTKISDVTIKKWIKQFNLIPPTIKEKIDNHNYANFDYDKANRKKLIEKIDKEIFHNSKIKI